jgi:dTDP-4-amino-4,6-dideoxygalactose transaminase
MSLVKRSIPLNNQKTIPFSPPDITQEEIDEIFDALKSG